MYPVERDRTKARVCRRSLGGKQEVGGEVGNSVDGSGEEEDTRMFENNEQYSIESRVGDLRFQNKQGHDEEIEMAT